MVGFGARFFTYHVGRLSTFVGCFQTSAITLWRYSFMVFRVLPFYIQRSTREGYLDFLHTFFDTSTFVRCTKRYIITRYIFLVTISYTCGTLR